MPHSDVPSLSVPVSELDNQQGPQDAPVTLLEYGDYQCPDAAHMHPAVEQILDESGDKILYVFRHFPIASHARAIPAAEAAQAAGAQGKYFEMHHHLFQSLYRLTDRHFEQYAELLSLDLDQFRADLREHRHLERVQSDLEGAKQGGVHASPTFFINGQFYAGKRDLEQLRAAVHQALA